jgi:integrase/recombinase XerD
MSVIDPKKDPGRRCLPIRSWPDPDRRAWDAAMRQGDILEPGGDGASWAFHSQRKIAKGYGRWLTWLDTQGLLDHALSPTARVAPDRVREYVVELRLINAPYTVLTRVQELYQALSVTVPVQDWSWLRAIENRVRHGARSVRNKRLRVVPIETLFALGLELMTQAQGPGAGTPLNQARQFRDGLMIALLAARPLRRRNFARIELGRHLAEAEGGYALRFTGEETKTGRPIDAPLPNALIVPLQRYLSDYRPILLASNGRWRSRGAVMQQERALWVSGDGSAMTEIAIYFRIRKLTRERFGHVVNPHLFRDCTATSIAVEDPEHVHIISSILDHTLQTSERHYIHAQALEASRRYQQQIIKLRRGPRHP